VTYRDPPEKQKVKPPPGAWHRFIEALVVVSVALWLVVVNGLGVYWVLKVWLPAANGVFALIATVVFGVCVLAVVFNLAERRQW
jgi:polyferredoxin